MAKQGVKANGIGTWFHKIDAPQRRESVCKPCWELKYCPYGVLIEDFPLAKLEDDRRCSIFGHVCPVFQVAEPFTETKELRNISRSISRSVQFRVLQRDNQICRECGHAIEISQVRFDHIIPWSKGGPSDEHNIQLLCDACNRKKSDNFEAEYLVGSVVDHISEPVGVATLEAVLFLVDVSNKFRATNGRLPNADDFAEQLSNGDKTNAEERAAHIVRDVDAFFRGHRPREIPSKVFKALRSRWGFTDGHLYLLKSVADEFGLDSTVLLDAEVFLLKCLGWRVSLNKTQRGKWLRS